MADDMILELEKLRVETITGRVLVDNVDVTLRRGEILGLIGESGAGKSTIGLASMAYARAGMRITGGSITLDGTELRASTAAQPGYACKSVADPAPDAAPGRPGARGVRLNHPIGISSGCQCREFHGLYFHLDNRG